MMEVSYSVTERKSALITPRESIRVAIETLRREFDLPERCRVVGGREFDDGSAESITVRRTVEHNGGSHSWDSDEHYREHREGDRRVLAVIDMLLEADNAHADAGDFR